MIFRSKFAFLIFTLGLLCLTLPLPLSADTTYTYTGNNYTSCFGTYCTGGPYVISLTFDVKAGTQLDNLTAGTNISTDVSTFSFVDGSGLSITQSNGVGHFYVGTDASGDITSWNIEGSAPYNIDISTQSNGTFATDETFAEPTVTSGETGSGWNVNEAGCWTNQACLPTSPVPEPSSLFLFGTGLAGLVGAVRRRLLR
jgi:hypothetical protein